MVSLKQRLKRVRDALKRRFRKTETKKAVTVPKKTTPTKSNTPSVSKSSSGSSKSSSGSSKSSSGSSKSSTDVEVIEIDPISKKQTKKFIPKSEFDKIKKVDSKPKKAKTVKISNVKTISEIKASNKAKQEALIKKTTGTLTKAQPRKVSISERFEDFKKGLTRFRNQPAIDVPIGTGEIQISQEETFGDFSRINRQELLSQIDQAKQSELELKKLQKQLTETRKEVSSSPAGSTFTLNDGSTVTKTQLLNIISRDQRNINDANRSIKESISLADSQLNNIERPTGFEAQNVVRNAKIIVDVDGTVTVTGAKLTNSQKEALKQQKEDELEETGLPSQRITEQLTLVVDPTQEGAVSSAGSNIPKRPTDFVEASVFGGITGTKQILTEIGVTEAVARTGQSFGIDDLFGSETELERVNETGGTRNLRETRLQAFRESKARKFEDGTIDPAEALDLGIDFLESPVTQVAGGGVVGSLASVGIKQVTKRVGKRAGVIVGGGLTTAGIVGSGVAVASAQKEDRLAVLGNLGLAWYGAYLGAGGLKISSGGGGSQGTKGTANIKKFTPVKVEIVGVQKQATIKNPNGKTTKVTGQILRLNTQVKVGRKNVNIKQFLLKTVNSNGQVKYLLKTPPQTSGNLKIGGSSKVVKLSDVVRVDRAIIRANEKKITISKRKRVEGSVGREDKTTKIDRSTADVDQLEIISPAEQGVDALFLETSSGVGGSSSRTGAVASQRGKLIKSKGRITDDEGVFDFESNIVQDELLFDELITGTSVRKVPTRITKPLKKQVQRSENEVVDELLGIPTVSKPTKTSNTPSKSKSTGGRGGVKSKIKTEEDSVFDADIDDILGVPKAVRSNKIKGRTKQKRSPASKITSSAVVGINSLIDVAGDDVILGIKPSSSGKVTTSVKKKTTTSTRSAQATATDPLLDFDFGFFAPPTPPRPAKPKKPKVPITPKGKGDPLDQILNSVDSGILSTEKDIAELDDILG